MARDGAPERGDLSIAREPSRQRTRGAAASLQRHREHIARALSGDGCDAAARVRRCRAVTGPVDRDRASARPAPEFPRGYRVDTIRPDVFDPALRHYPFAFVKGDPGEPAAAQRVRDARAWLLSRVMVALSRAGLRDALVARGGVALERWFPQQARRPRDVDLVARDPRWAPDDTRSMILMDSIRAAVVDVMARADVRVLAREVTVDEIWTFERAEGRRLSVPWEAADGLHDTVQIDLVFREPLHDAPSLEPVGELGLTRGYRDAPVDPQMWFASRPESLAWKLLWLETDVSPRARDLYDAALLAEHVSLPLDLVTRVFEARGARWSHDVDTAYVRSWEISDEGFAQEYPELGFTDAAPWLDRLARALTLTR